MLAAMMVLDKKAATGRRERSSGRVFGDRSEVHLASAMRSVQLSTHKDYPGQIKARHGWPLIHDASKISSGRVALLIYSNILSWSFKRADHQP